MTNSAIFTDQTNLPPTTQRPDFSPANPYAKKQFDAATSEMPQLEYDQALIHKYNRSGPRYTSYPTALGSLSYNSHFAVTFAITVLVIKSSPKRTVMPATI